MNKKDLNLIFMGTPQIAADVFEAMILDGYHFVALIAQPDKPVGRKAVLEKVPTKIIAEKYNIPCFQPLKIRKDYEFVKTLNPDCIITLAYGQIVPQGLLDIPQYGCINLHGSLLPKYRGAAPIQYALINGDQVTGVTLMEMIDKMDAGRMYAKKEVVISNDDNSTTLFKKIGNAAKELILDALPKYINGELKGEIQDESGVSFAPTIKPEEEKINFNLPIKNIVGWINALSDHPGAYTFIDGKKIKIFKAKILNLNKTDDNKKIIEADKNGLVIQCIDGQLSVLELQKEGKKRMDYRSFINGNPNLKGLFVD